MPVARGFVVVHMINDYPRAVYGYFTEPDAAVEFRERMMAARNINLEREKALFSHYHVMPFFDPRPKEE